MLLFTLFISAHTYYSYYDCSPSCRVQRLACVIRQGLPASFVVECIEPSSCIDEADAYTPCISEDAPTIGGGQVWERYKNRPRPPKPPAPIPVERCYVWKIITAGHTTMSISLIAFFLVRLIIRMRNQREYERLPEIGVDSPYQPTTEDIPEGESA
jgi:hypothetical protein